MGWTLYDHASPVNFAYRGELTTEQIGADPALAPMLTEDTVLMDDGSGKVYDFRYLRDLKACWDIEEEDPETALELVWEAMNAPKVTTEDLTVMVDALGEASVEGVATTDDLQNQIDIQGQCMEELINAVMGG